MSFKTTLYGKYFLLDRIAVGGMAEVFKAKTYGVRGFERLLVIKRILPHLSKDEEFVEMFIDEAKISVELNHANICQVTDLGKIGDNFFIAMEHIDGKDLRAILKKCHTQKTPLAVPGVIFVAMEILKGLDYAHRKTDLHGKPIQLIHRDISPQNIMVSYHGEVKIVDFGIAKTESKLNRTQAGVLKGKFGYMSPEQASGLELDGRTDVFSAGIILFEMLTGRRLFLGENDFETLEKIKECQVPPPGKYNPSVGADLEGIVLKALSKEREDRFPSAQDMLAALAKIFYTHYSGFSAHDFSAFIRALFAEEIEKEQEALRRAVDSLPPEELEAAISGAESAEDRIVDSASARRSTSGGGAVRASGSRRTEADRTLPKSEPGASARHVKTAALVLVPALGIILAWGLFGPSKRKPADAVAPAAHPTQPSAPVTEPTHAPATASLKIESEPAGARVFLNQEDTGRTTPAVLDGLALNRPLKLRLELDGFRPLSTTLTLRDPDGAKRFFLEPLLVTLNLRITPQDASVFVDGRERGHLVENLPAGRHKLRVAAPGYRSEMRTITLNASHEDLNIDLKRIKVDFGTISFGAEPWAKVLVDGKEVGETPVAEQQLSVGTHVVEFVHPDYKTIRKKIEIRLGKNRSVIVRFSE